VVADSGVMPRLRVRDRDLVCLQECFGGVCDWTRQGEHGNREGHIIVLMTLFPP
jgi:hypothetical protein